MYANFPYELGQIVDCQNGWVSKFRLLLGLVLKACIVYKVFLAFVQKYEKGGMNVMISAEKVTDLDQTTKDWLLDLITRNMKALYEESDWGWKTENKKEEMFDNRAW